VKHWPGFSPTEIGGMSSIDATPPWTPIAVTHPVVSVIVPLVHHMGQAVESVTRWTRQRGYPRECIEILVVSDGSEPALDQQLQAVLGPQDRVLRHASAWERERLDYGARQARGELLVFTEPHVLAEPDFLHEMVTFLKTTGHTGACCRLVGRYHNAIGRQAYLEFVKLFRVWSAPGNAGKVLIHGFTIDRRAYLAVGGYLHQYLGYADVPLAMRLEQDGYSLGYAPRAEVCHVFFDRLGNHLDRVRDYTIGQLAYRRDHPGEECASDSGPRGSASGSDSHIAKTLLRHVPRALVRVDVALLRAAFQSCRELARRPRLARPLAVANWRRSLAILRTHCWRWHPGRLESAYQAACQRTAEWTRLRFLADDARAARRLPHAAAAIGRDGRGSSWSIQELPGDRLVGFHDVEVWQGRVFRWSLPTAGLRLALPAGGCRVVLDTGAIRSDVSEGLRVFVDARRVPSDSVQTVNGQVTFPIPPEPNRDSESFLFWICSPLEPSRLGQPDRRRLGLPLVSVALQPSEDVLSPAAR
jgi:hypothetical protein